jgi:hypothetical protein
MIGDSMSRVVRFVRERNPFILIVYCLYVSFIFFKSFFKHFKLIIYRSHKSILSWFRLSISDGDICRDVRVLLVDDTRIKIGSGEGIVYCF